MPALPILSLMQRLSQSNSNNMNLRLDSLREMRNDVTRVVSISEWVDPNDVTKSFESWKRLPAETMQL